MPPKVLRFNHPAYSASDWSTENPFLNAGEVGIQLDGGGLAEDMRVGPGLWNDLASILDPPYPFTETVTNEIGDIKIGEDRSGDKITLMMRDMITPYIEPLVSNQRNDAVGAAVGTAILKVGQTVDTQVIVSYTLNTLGIPNLLPSDNISITSVGALFSNEGSFTHGTGSIAMLLIAALTATPETLTTFEIKIFARGTQGDTAEASTFIAFYPEVLFGNSSLTSLLANEVALLVNRVTTNSYKSDYVFGAADYHYIAIPQQLGIVNPVFTDVTNPNSPTTMSFLFMQTYTNLNNGVGTYNYDLYRSEQLLLTPKIVRVS